jgi:hypothetical protein
MLGWYFDSKVNHKCVRANWLPSLPVIKILDRLSHVIISGQLNRIREEQFSFWLELSASIDTTLRMSSRYSQASIYRRVLRYSRKIEETMSNERKFIMQSYTTSTVHSRFPNPSNMQQ